MSKNNISRRDLLKIAATTSSAAALGSVLPGPGIFTPTALAQGAEKAAVFCIFLPGGYNSLFTSADSFIGAGTFGVTNQNMLNLGNGLVVDSSFNTLGAFAKQHMATVGVRHGQAAHGAAKSIQFTLGNANPVMSLASGMGGPGSIKAANVGAEMAPGPQGAVSGVSLQQVTDMQSTIDALGGSNDPTMPKRDIAAKGLTASQGMSLKALDGNPLSLASVGNGYKAAIETLIKPAEAFSPAELQAAYGVTGTAVNDFKSKMAAAELMIRAGSNVVTLVDGGGLSWDTHGDRTGARVRQRMAQQIMPALKTFTDRMLQAEGRNVTIIIFGDFARSLPGSDHASVTSATVIGKYVKVGTTGKVDANVGLPENTPGVNGLWGYLAALSKAPASVVQGFGGNPHTSIIL